jgi:hypothetical protein
VFQHVVGDAVQGCGAAGVSDVHADSCSGRYGVGAM